MVQDSCAGGPPTTHAARPHAHLSWTRMTGGHAIISFNQEEPTATIGDTIYMCAYEEREGEDTKRTSVSDLRGLQGFLCHLFSGTKARSSAEALAIIHHSLNPLPSEGGTSSANIRDTCGERVIGPSDGLLAGTWNLKAPGLSTINTINVISLYEPDCSYLR